MPPKYSRIGFLQLLGCTVYSVSALGAIGAIAVAVFLFSILFAWKAMAVGGDAWSYVLKWRSGNWMAGLGMVAVLAVTLLLLKFADRFGKK